VWNYDSIGTGHAQSALNSAQAWSAHYNNVGQWLTLNLQSARQVSGIQVQGRGDDFQYVLTYNVQYYVQGRGYVYVENEHNSRTFASTSTGQAVSTVMFANAVNTQYVKVLPQTWHSHMSMRCDVLIGQGSRCLSCPPAKYQPSLAVHSCLQCTAGQFTNSSGSSSCTPCPAGRYGGGGSGECTECMLSKYQPNLAAMSCLQCPSGNG
jgi:hypothetical protein